MDTVIVTGGASGIGAAIVRLAKEQGLNPVVWDLSPGGMVVDTRDRAAVEAALAEVGPARYLVNNAGPASSTNLTFSAGLEGTAGSVELVTSAWLATDPPDGAAVVNVASVAGNLVGTDSAWYSAGKAAIAGYTRHLATRLAPKVRANAVAPGFIETPRMAGFADSPLGRALVERNPMRRAGRPEDVAAAVLFLLSPAAAYVNGVLLPVDGGWTVTQ
ncbi:SDR family oxidoreductase [Dactylosporangium sp. AC04546]|uniref:SDR family NAD(P)-dependent oxidoreductase n=1 Tax=Dactylosporangium sp. AC04546 TaxID=2862460 RepID=UPI001EDF5797|nr:SDR family oxidoreductase [Dactylosporangium sp. AC04546]WVK78332.1 SDR family oxidoreductase [Dactylosporangium sp. AC04546]